MRAPSSPRPAVWRALGLGAVFLLAAAAASIALVSSGRLDPRLPGPRQLELGPQTVAVSAEEAALLWQEPALPEPPYTVRLQATSTGAETASYGLALGSPEAYLAAVVSPAGAASVTVRRPGRPEEALHWRSELAAEPVREAELQIDAQADAVTVWVNRQVIWQGEWATMGRQVGLLVRGEGGAAAVTFEVLEVFGR
jgi:hypothetical protein